MIGKGGLDSLAMGQHGSVYINNVSANTGQWGVIYALAATVFTSLTSGSGPDGTAVMKPGTGVASLAGMALPAGGAIFGYFTAVQLTSGAVICYNV